MLKAIFWDNDGVLVNTEHLYFLATQYVLATVGIPLTQEQYIELFLVQGKGAWHLAADKGVSPSAIAQLRHARNTLYSTLLSQEPLLIAGVREVLDALHGTYVMGIVTSSEPDPFALIHQRTGLLPYFRFVLTASDYTHSKPHPEPYLLAVERSGFRQDECLVNESPRSKLRGIKPPLAYSCGPPVWRGGGWCLLGMCCLRTLEQPQLDVLAMQLRIAFVTALLPHICAHDGCIPMTAYGTDAIPFGPQLASPQTLFDGGDTAENETLCLLCR